MTKPISTNQFLTDDAIRWVMALQTKIWSKSKKVAKATPCSHCTETDYIGNNVNFEHFLIKDVVTKFTGKTCV